MANLRTNNLFGESGKDPNGSALFDGSGHLTAANASAFRINYGTTEDYTLEAWIFLKEAPSGNARIAAIYHTSGNQRSYMFYVSSSLELKYNYAGSSSGGAGSVSTLNAGDVPLNEWVHVAVSHDTNTTTLRIYKNGLEKATDNAPHTTYFQNTSGDFVIGQDFPAGFISNLHIARGTCKYKTDFTPYREPIEEISDTTVLCCNSSVDVLSDDKSNTFTQSVDGAVEVSSFIPFDRAYSGNIFNGPIKHNTQGYMYFPTGRTEERGRGRGVLSGGRNDHAMQFINIQSQGNSITFGDSVTGDGVEGYATGSSVRGLFSGTHPSTDNVIEFITFATQSNGTDFGDTTEGRRSGAGLGNDTRGIFCGGIKSNSASTNIMDFVTFTTLGNATDFGDMTEGRDQLAGVNDTTRGCLCGGVVQPGSHNNTIDFITTATTGNAQDFGDMENGFAHSSGASGKTRGLMATGYSPNFNTNINFITIQTTGNTKDFGDLLQARSIGAGMSNTIRGVYAGGYNPSPSFTAFNIIDFVNIESTGNALDFGDLSLGANYVLQAASDSHGGLSE